MGMPGMKRNRQIPVHDAHPRSSVSHSLLFLPTYTSNDTHRHYQTNPKQVRGQALRPHAPEIVLRTADFLAGVGATAEGYAAAVIAQEKGALLGGGEGLEGYVEGYAAKAAGWDSLPHTLAAARAQARIRPGSGKGEGVVALLEREGPVRGASVEGLRDALRVLEGELGVDEGVLAAAKTACAKRFPLAGAFK